MKKYILSILLMSLVLFSQSCADYKPLKTDYSISTNPAAPDYGDPFFWSALPDRQDFADHIPIHSPVELIDGQKDAVADVFYIHPTTFFSREEWNADLHDEKVNKSTDERAVKNQATAFNGSCKVYAPRYRQAAYNAYFSLTSPDAMKAFELAYEDIKNAFQYYLDHYNNGRPIIIAGHSQGTTMAKWLLRDFFDGTPLQNQLVCAYLIGMPVYKNEFTSIPPCDSANQIGCYITWRSYVAGNEPKPKFIAPDKENVVVNNPLTYTRDAQLANTDCNAGGLGRDGETIYPGVCSAQIHNDIVWVSKPDVPGKAFIPNNLHVADYNLYWLNIRENVALRIQTYLLAGK